MNRADVLRLRQRVHQLIEAMRQRPHRALAANCLIEGDNLFRHEHHPLKSDPLLHRRC